MTLLRSATILDLSRLTPSAKAVLENLEFVAHEDGRNWIGVDAFIKAILLNEQGSTAVALRSLGVTPETFEAALKQAKVKVG